MFFSKKNKEANRYYLLPGMGRSNRRRHRQFMVLAIAVGIAVAVLVAALLYTLDRAGR